MLGIRHLQLLLYSNVIGEILLDVQKTNDRTFCISCRPDVRLPLMLETTIE